MVWVREGEEGWSDCCKEAEREEGWKETSQCVSETCQRRKLNLKIPPTALTWEENNQYKRAPEVCFNCKWMPSETCK